MIITSQRNCLGPADASDERSPETKMAVIFLTAKCGNVFLNFAICFFFYDLTSNKGRELEVAASKLSMEIFLALTLFVGWDVFPSLSPSRFISRTLSLFLTLLLMPHFSSCYVGSYHLPAPHGPSIKMKLASLKLLASY